MQDDDIPTPRRKFLNIQRKDICPEDILRMKSKWELLSGSLFSQLITLRTQRVSFNPSELYFPFHPTMFELEVREITGLCALLHRHYYFSAMYN